MEKKHEVSVPKDVESYSTSSRNVCD